MPALTEKYHGTCYVISNLLSAELYRKGHWIVNATAVCYNHFAVPILWSEMSLLSSISRSVKGLSKEAGLSYKNGLSNETEGKKRIRMRFWVVVASVAVVAAGIIIAILSALNVLGGVDQSAYSISYNIEPIIETGYLNVEVNIEVHRLSSDRGILLLKGSMPADFTECKDESGNDVLLTETDDLVAIGPIDAGSGKLCLKYDVYIGEISSDYSANAIPYSQGCILEDLIVFSGENVLLIPFLDPNSFDSIGKYIRNISLEFNAPDGLDPIVPYQTRTLIEGQPLISVDRPDWEFFNTIIKSAFCFGRFDRLLDNGILGNAVVYIDAGAVNGVSQVALEALEGLFNYYTVIFGEPLGDVPVVLLRNLDYEDTVITGGAGSGGSAISANLRIAEDVRAMSSMVYHTFFDSKVKSRNLRYTGNNWIYRGLSEYCVGNSVGYLSEDVVDAYEIGTSTPMNELYLRYLYFSLKEPGFLGVSPIHETTGMYVSQEEFYMGVKVPNIIAAINYTIEERTEQTDGFLKELVKNGGGAKPLDVMKLLKDVCGPDYDMIENYLSGQALIPNYNKYNIDHIPAERLLYILDDDERKYAYFFEENNVFYPYTALILLHEDAFMSEVAARGIRYNTVAIQNEVKGFSSVLHRLLLQYATWASMASIDDITLPNIKREITQAEVMDRWRSFCGEIGIEYGVGDYVEGVFDNFYYDDW